jgi:hypothetical protein
MELGGYAFRAVSTRKGTSPGGGDDIWGFDRKMMDLVLNIPYNTYDMAFLMT